MEVAIKIRRIESGDVAAVLAIQLACPGLAQWTQLDYENAARGDMPAWVAARDMKSASPKAQTAQINQAIAGFLVARLAATEFEILNLAVDPSARRQGIATKLLQKALQFAAENQAKRAYLEVRESNSEARKFYESHGFHATGRRPNYYSAPPEDALQLAAHIA